MDSFQIEGPQLMQYGFRDAIAKVGLYKFLSDLFWIGMFYHLYNQVCYRTCHIQLLLQSKGIWDLCVWYMLMLTWPLSLPICFNLHLGLWYYPLIRSLVLGFLLTRLLLHDQSMWILKNAIIWEDFSYKVEKMHH